MSEATENKELTVSDAATEIKRLREENDKLKAEATPTEFDKRLNAFVNGATFGSIGRKLEIIRRDDPDFFRALIESAPHRPELYFGRASHASLAMTLKKEAPELYKQARARAVQLGLLAADPLREDDALHGKIRFQ